MKAIVAVDWRWGIGKDNKLLFQIPADLKRFQELTADGMVIMGRNTYDSLPHKSGLPGRTNIVLSHNPIDSPTIRSCEFEGLMIETDHHTDNVFVIGGAAIYELLLPYCDTVYLTRVYKSVEHDKKMVNLDKHPDWYMHNRSKMMHDIDKNTGEEVFFMYYTYKKIPSIKLNKFREKEVEKK
ncbi:MAG: dihydrofolate reductase [Bacilli bacterium]|nr:dihydrofolate reductase [Bacilli bacterium]